MFYKLFLKHPQKENMSYFQHFCRAIKLSASSFKASVFLLVHAFVPKYFEHDGSDTINNMYRQINKREV